jgi:hypothetical protein
MINPRFILNSSVLVIFSTRLPGTKVTEREDSEVDAISEGKLGRAHDFASITLAGIRLLNGVAALFVPAWLARRLGVDPDANPAALYALRLFGVRTVLIGAQLLLRDSGMRAHSLRVAPVIHALDATAALIAGDRGQLCPGARLRRKHSSRPSMPSWPSSRRPATPKMVERTNGHTDSRLRGCLCRHGCVHVQREVQRCDPGLRNGGTGIRVADGRARNAPGTLG